MKSVLIAISIVSLVVLFVTPTLHAAGLVSVRISHVGMILGTIGWFASAIFWIRPRRD